MSLYTKMKGNVTYTIIGNPTITDGVVSDFSSSDYLKLSKTYTQIINILEFVIKINITPTTITNNACVLALNGTNNLRVYVNPSKNLMLLFYDINNTQRYLSAGTVSAGYYKYILGYNISPKVYYSNDGINWTLKNSTSYKPRLISITDSFIGYSSSTYNVYDGSIDLNETYININRLAWFGDSFSRVKVRTGLTKYTVVGSPTIENGIASNFSNNNYLELHNFDPSKPFELRAKINTTQIGQRQVIYGVGTAGVLRFLIFTNGKIEMDLGTSTSSFNICTLQSSITLSINTDYWVSLVFTGNKYIMSYSTDGDTFTELGSVNSTLLINNGNAFTVRIGIGVVSSTTTFFNGSIDLNASYIKTNNGYFFRGSHQNINFWKIRDSHKDSWYKIVDGKLISANENIYLESTGTQWIDTGIKANQNTILKCKVATIGSGNQSFFGLVDNSNIYGIGQQASGSLLFAQYYGSGSYRITAMAGNDGIARKFEFIKNEFYIDGVLIGSKTYKTFTTTNTIKLFTLEPSGTLGKDKGYYFEIYDDTVLICKFVPVPTGLKIGDFIIPSNGMFDIVNQQFYENQGTGDFIINKD